LQEISGGRAFIYAFACGDAMVGHDFSSNQPPPSFHITQRTMAREIGFGQFKAPLSKTGDIAPNRHKRRSLEFHA